MIGSDYYMIRAGVTVTWEKAPGSQPCHFQVLPLHPWGDQGRCHRLRERLFSSWDTQTHFRGPPLQNFNLNGCFVLWTDELSHGLDSLEKQATTLIGPGWVRQASAEGRRDNTESWAEKPCLLWAHKPRLEMSPWARWTFILYPCHCPN